MNKLRSKKGFTLTEMLIAVLLLGFVTLMATVMTTAVLNTTFDMQEVAQAEILGSNALDNLQGKLRVAKSVKFDDKGNVTFDIDDANKGYMFDIDDGKIVFGKGKDGALSGEANLLFAGSSYGNLNIKELNFALSEDEASVEITLSVAYGEKTLWSGSVSVKPLNGIKTTT